MKSFRKNPSRNELSSRRETSDPMSARQTISDEEIKVQYTSNETIESKTIDVNLTPSDQKRKPSNLKSQLK